MDFLNDDVWQVFAQRWLGVFLLVVARLSGLLAISPVLGHPNLPRQVRALLILALAFIVAPAVAGITPRQQVRRWDGNSDQRLSRSEIPTPLLDEFDTQLAERKRLPDETLAFDEFSIPPPAPNTLVDFTAIAVAEFAVGFALGLGVLVILSAMQLAGHLIDYQTGLSLGQIFNPQFGTTSSLSGELLLSLGTTLYLLTGGHVLLINALLQTFEAIPVGYASLSTPAVELLSGLVQQSLVLALQMSAPIVLTLTLVGFAMGILGHTVTTINFIDVGIPVRILAGLFLFSLALVRMAELLAGRFTESLGQLLEVLI